MEISIFAGITSQAPFPMPLDMSFPIIGEMVAIDIFDGGSFCRSGTVAIDSSPDIPVHRKVRLICTRTGRLVREVWSDPITGAYVFSGIRQGPWTVLSHDYSGVYNAVASDIGVATPL